MEEGGDLLELFGSDLVAHRHSPRAESRGHPPNRPPGPPHLLTEGARACFSDRLVGSQFPWRILIHDGERLANSPLR